MKIQFKPQFGMASVTHVLTNTQWYEGEIKDIDDEATFRQLIDGEAHYVKYTDDLLSSPNFCLADSGENLNYICTNCGGSALEEGYQEASFITPQNPSGLKTVLFENDGDRLCSQCFHNSKAPEATETPKEEN